MEKAEFLDFLEKVSVVRLVFFLIGLGCRRTNEVLEYIYRVEGWGRGDSRDGWREEHESRKLEGSGKSEVELEAGVLFFKISLGTEGKSETSGEGGKGLGSPGSGGSGL